LAPILILIPAELRLSISLSINEGNCCGSPGGCRCQNRLSGWLSLPHGLDRLHDIGELVGEVVSGKHDFDEHTSPAALSLAN
jgi:hypothetical protein